jgi:hypothetical protein
MFSLLKMTAKWDIKKVSDTPLSPFKSLLIYVWHMVSS